MTDSYSKRRPLAEFLEWIEKWSQGMMGLAKIDALLNPDRETKRMKEEALPVYFYVRRFYQGQNVSVELTGVEDTPDAKVYDSDGRIIEGLEVTNAYQEIEAKDFRLRQKLSEGLDLGDYISQSLSLSLDKYIQKSVLRVLKAKEVARHESNTSLIVLLNTDFTLDEMATTAIRDEIANAVLDHKFKRIVFFAPNGGLIAELPSVQRS